MEILEANAFGTQASLQPKENGSEGKRNEGRPVEYSYYRYRGQYETVVQRMRG